MSNRPRRLDDFPYIGFFTYSLTICTRRRHRAFQDCQFAGVVRDQLLRLARARGFAVIAYCFMPDHVHVLIQGKSVTADLRSLVLSWKTRSGHAWRQKHGSRLWQEGYYDHVLRENESFLGLARYIVENPVRAKLVESAESYPLSGSTEYGLAEILRMADECLPILFG